MLILLNILKAIAAILDVVVTFYSIVLFARVIMSWIRIPYNQISEIIYRITEPVLAPLRRRLPMSMGIDFSPMIVFILLMVIKMVVVTSIYQYVSMYQMKYMMNP
jgi:YggT family protein